MQPAEWMDLSGAELRARLCNRGVPPHIATYLEYYRESHQRDICTLLSPAAVPG